MAAEFQTSFGINSSTKSVHQELYGMGLHGLAAPVGINVY